MDKNDEASDKTSSSSSLHKRRSGKRAGPHPLQQDATGGGTPAGAPCGACKFLRRKCMSGCIFAPHFGSEQGAALFAAMHKVFGASNVSKLLLHLPASQRHDAVVTISYEAQARLSDPVYGCVSTILALQHQVATLQAELSIVQTQLISSRAVANALQNSNLQQHEQQQQLPHIAMLQPAYSNNSSASNNLINMGGFPTSFDPTSESALSSRNFKPLQLSGPSPDDEEDEEESRNPDNFNNKVLQGK